MKSPKFPFDIRPPTFNSFNVSSPTAFAFENVQSPRYSPVAAGPVVIPESAPEAPLDPRKAFISTDAKSSELSVDDYDDSIISVKHKFSESQKQQLTSTPVFALFPAEPSGEIPQKLKKIESDMLKGYVKISGDNNYKLFITDGDKQYLVEKVTQFPRSRKQDDNTWILPLSRENVFDIRVKYSDYVAKKLKESGIDQTEYQEEEEDWLVRNLLWYYDDEIGALKNVEMDKVRVLANKSGNKIYVFKSNDGEDFYVKTLILLPDKYTLKLNAEKFLKILQMYKPILRDATTEILSEIDDVRRAVGIGEAPGSENWIDEIVA